MKHCINNEARNAESWLLVQRSHKLEETWMLLTLHQISKLKVSEIIKHKKLFPPYAKYSPAILCRHALKPLDGGREVDGKHNKQRET